MPTPTLLPLLRPPAALGDDRSMGTVTSRFSLCTRRLPETVRGPLRALRWPPVWGRAGSWMWAGWGWAPRLLQARPPQGPPEAHRLREGGRGALGCSESPPQTLPLHVPWAPAPSEPGAVVSWPFPPCSLGLAEPRGQQHAGRWAGEVRPCQGLCPAQRMCVCPPQGTAGP